MHSRYYLLTFAAVVVASICVGCATNQGAHSLAAYHTLVAKRQYYAAYLAFLSIRNTLTEMQEGFEGLEYQRLVTAVAGSGEREWIAIFKDGSIPLRMKADLLDEIHEQSQRNANQTGCNIGSAISREAQVDSR